MSIKYDSRRQPLADIIEKSSKNAIYLIPDLQRPYVWSPKQVILLIDSLFKGWPFGSLLLWEIHPDCYQEGEGIPHRPFWQVVDRTHNNESTVNSTMGQPATYYMVLDGQQRIQSLLLALGGDNWGFKLYDHDWSLDLQDRRMKSGRHWSQASLCIDLDAFQAELKLKNSKVRKVEINQILNWIVTDRQQGRSNYPVPANYEHPLRSSWEHPGRFIRLSRMWDLAHGVLSETEYREILESFLADQQLTPEQVDLWKQPLSEFMKIIEAVRNSSYVHALQIESFRITPQWTKDDYDDSIVNIFTRLNTAGRTLTREEITLAWLKVGWENVEPESNSAGKCLEQLRVELSEHSLNLSTDELVRLISFIWAVEERDGLLLEARDLLKGDVIRPMAKYVSANWRRIFEQVSIGAAAIQSRSLYDNMGSVNALIVFWGWMGLVSRWLANHDDMRVVDKDSFDKMIDTCIDSFLDRWIIGSQWANVWAANAVQNFRRYAEILGKGNQRVRAIRDPNGAIDAFDRTLADLLDEIVEPAADYISHLTVKDRNRVYLYRSALWVWHRLDEDRWKMSAIPMRTGRKRNTRLEVDHTVADAMWKRKVDAEIQEKRVSITEELSLEEMNSLGPDGFETGDTAFEFINTLGNCALLDKSFNISKSDQQMWDFLKEVHEFKGGHENSISRADWQRALCIEDGLMEPESVGLQDLKTIILDRDRNMRSELTDFIRGKIKRQDGNEA